MINLIIGLIIGSIIGIFLMCLLQINRDNELKNRINKAIEYIKGSTNYDKTHNYRFFICCDETCHANDLLNILGGDVDDE